MLPTVPAQQLPANVALIPAQLDLSHLTDIHQSETPVAPDQLDLSNLAETPAIAKGNREGKVPTTMFGRLVLEKWHRDIIVSLISQHFRDKKSTTSQREEFDIVKGKGTEALHGLMSH